MATIEATVMWRSVNAPSIGTTKALIILDEDLGITITRASDGMFLACIQGPMSPKVKGRSSETVKEYLERWPSMVAYAKHAIAKGIFDVQEEGVFTKSVKFADDFRNPTVENCVFSM